MPGGLGAGGLGATLGRAGMREASSEPGGSASTDHEAAAPVEAVLLAGASCRPQGLALPEPRSRVERRSRKHLDLGVASPRFGRAKALPSLSRLRRGAGSDALSAAASPLARLPEAYRWSSYRAATALAAGPPELAEIFSTEAEPILVAYRRYGYTLREIAGHLGCHYQTVSRRLRRSERAA